MTIEARGALLAAGGFAAQRRDAARVQRRPAERGAVVDRQPGRHRRGPAVGDAPRREDRPARRGVVAAVDQRTLGAAAASTRSGAAASGGHLRRFDRQAVLQRVELLRRGRQGDVREQEAVPCWLVFDEGYVRRYASTANPLHRGLPQESIDSGAIRKADTLEALARMIDVDPDGLVRTVARFDDERAEGARPRLRPRAVRVQRLPRRSGLPAEPRDWSARPGTLLRHRDLPR